MTDPPGESMPTVLRRLAGNVGALLQTYAVLAGQETRATARDLATGLLLLAAAVFLGVLASTMVVVTLVLLLSLVLRPWEAAAVVFALTGLVMVLCIELGIRRVRRKRLLTMFAAFKEDVRWLRGELVKKD